MRILTGQSNPNHPYLLDHYPARIFRKMGHTVDETGLYDPSIRYDLGFIVQNQWREPRKWLGYPVGIWGSDCTDYYELYSKYEAKNYEVMFVDVYDMVSQYKEFSHRAVYLPYCCDPEIHRGVPSEELFDVGYIGEGRKKRDRRLRALRQSGLKVYTYYSRGFPGPEHLPGGPFLTWPEACKRYSQCKMIFSYGRDAALSKRVFEAMSIGKLVLANRKGSEPDNLFVDGKHLVAYNNADDLVEKAKYYASNPTERRAIAEAGQRLVHEKHKWTDRMNFVIKTLLETT